MSGVLLVHYSTPSILGGVEQVMGAHAAGLRDAGYRVTIAAGRGRLPHELRGVRLVRIPEMSTRHAAIRRDFQSLARGAVTPNHAVLAQRLERALRPHVARAQRVLVHNAFTLHLNPALSAALEKLAREFPKRFVSWTHDLAWADEQYASQRHPGEPWDRFARAVRGVRYVTVSEDRARILAELTGLPRRQIAVVPNGMDAATLLGLSPAGRAIADHLRLLEADPLLLLPVRITRRKRVEAAIDAITALRAGRYPKAMLVVTGSPGPHNPENRRYAAELSGRAGPGVHLLHALGIRPSSRTIADLYALADFLVFPSDSEGFGIPMLEAGLTRLPIVCSELPVLRAIAGDAASYVPTPARGRDIARAVAKRTKEDPMVRLRRSVKGNDWERIVRESVVPIVEGR